ncbi:hypothetical protein DL762_001372 [Monosporascus cannonballus]|uniref:FAD dependent oxidoreductase domain-containing protein n=1 Tax=Monosporascus cannonballus TaxID=155416 RepID=A0ABY0HGE4_9PEZI|nr:hypothetical protein DL762_001372 [Monosporascus cannonballus]
MMKMEHEKLQGAPPCCRGTAIKALKDTSHNNEQPSVVVVGGGVFSTPTAYHLAQRGHASVTVLDRFDAPSEDSAAIDLNKVVRTDYPNQLYTKLGLEAMQRAGGSRARETAEKSGCWGLKYMTAEEIRQKWPVLTGYFPDWTNLWSPAAGWKWIYNNKGTCTGAISANGRIHQADIVILASGSNTTTLVKAKEEVVAQTMVICVMKPEPREVEKHKGIPVIDNFEQAALRPELRDGLAPDLSFRSRPYPGTENLYIVTIGSNHGFKFLPVICKYVVDILEGKLGQEWLDLWKWKFRKRPDSFQDPHPLPVRELSDLSG